MPGKEIIITNFNNEITTILTLITTNKYNERIIEAAVRTYNKGNSSSPIKIEVDDRWY